MCADALLVAEDTPRGITPFCRESLERDLSGFSSLTSVVPDFTRINLELDLLLVEPADVGLFPAVQACPTDGTTAFLELLQPMVELLNLVAGGINSGCRVKYHCSRWYRKIVHSSRGVQA